MPTPGFDMPGVPENPSEEERNSARDLLLEAVEDFPFSDEASWANALALDLSLIMRPAINGNVPLALVDAPQAGSGKGLIVQKSSTIATGREMPTTPAPDNDEEWRKKITASLLSGTSLLIIDNLEGKLEAPSLASLLTTKWWEDRIMKEHRNINLPVRLTVVATGNNIELSGDLPRRCYWIRIDAKTARPWQRSKFKHPALLAWVAENRGRLLAAALTLARAWFAAGKPPANNLPTIGSFEEWTKTVGGVLANAGVSGFLGNLEKLYKEADAAELQWENFLVALADAIKANVNGRFRSGTFTVKALLEEIAWNAEFRKALPDSLAYEENTRGYQTKWGVALRKRKGRRYGSAGIHLELIEEGNVNVWKVAQDSVPKQVSEVVDV